MGHFEAGLRLSTWIAGPLRFLSPCIVAREKLKGNETTGSEPRLMLMRRYSNPFGFEYHNAQLLRNHLSLSFFSVHLLTSLVLGSMLLSSLGEGSTLDDWTLRGLLGLCGY